MLCRVREVDTVSCGARRGPDKVAAILMLNASVQKPTSPQHREHISPWGWSHRLDLRCRSVTAGKIRPMARTRAATHKEATTDDA